MKSIFALAASLTLLTINPSAALADPGLNAFNLITHSEVRINRPAELIWPYILDTSGWKLAVESELIAGKTGQVGEIRQISGGSGEQAYRFSVETVALQTNHHKVIKIYPEDGSHFGFSAWRLFDLGDTTLVTYDVYSENRIPGLTVEQAGEQERLGVELNQPRFDQELLKLKDLLESTPLN